MQALEFVMAISLCKQILLWLFIGMLFDVEKQPSLANEKPVVVQEKGIVPRGVKKLIISVIFKGHRKDQ